jgi:hypothetical protein
MQLGSAFVFGTKCHKDSTLMWSTSMSSCFLNIFRQHTQEPF